MKKLLIKSEGGGILRYLAPEVTAVDISVERGFAVSNDPYGGEGEAGKGGGIYDYDDDF